MQPFKITCPHCGFSKNIDRDKIPAGVDQVRCPSCEEKFTLGAIEETLEFEAIHEPQTTPDYGTAPAYEPQGGPHESAPQPKFCSTCGNQVHINAEICPNCGVRVAGKSGAVNKVALLLITFFLGGIGGHKFYQKKYLQGTLYLLFFWTYIPSLAALVEFIIYACKSEPELQRAYPEAGGGGALVLVIAIPVVIAIIGILAAIAIPQFAAYRTRAYDAAANSDLLNCVTQAEAYYAENMAYPTSANQLSCQASENVALYYLAFSPVENQIISFHKLGATAYLSTSGEGDIAQNTREELENQIADRFGPDMLALRFHFIE